jgi:L-fucose mutarotase
MLNHQLIHPQINAILGRAGHHAKVLIADGNYPASTALGPRAELVSLNLAPGIVTCTQVLETLLTAVPIERLNTMDYERTGPYALSEDPSVWNEYRRAVSKAGLKLALEPIEKWEFYKA